MMNEKKCLHCGADYTLHRAHDNACPFNGQESGEIGEGHWMATTFEESGDNAPSARLTKREYIAVMAMQGILSNSVIAKQGAGEEAIAKWAINQADELLRQLENKV